MKKSSLILLNVLICLSLLAQKPFGHDKAIAADDISITGWATGSVIKRGWQNCADTNAGKVTLGEDWCVTGKAKDNNIVSLGDGGEAVVTFGGFISNGIGPDFAVFENGFSFSNDSTFYFEYAFVEVSSDGINYFRFPTQYFGDTINQAGFFIGNKPSNSINLAGNYAWGYGTPFDLEELKDFQGLNINHITHVKIIDAVGSLNDSFSQRDSHGTKINDPWPTPFNSGGFDLDAIAVMHGITGMENLEVNTFDLYPNPLHKGQNLSIDNIEKYNISIQDLSGVTIDLPNSSPTQLNETINRLIPGIYFISISDKDKTIIKKLCIAD